jgi:hypothetical protein
MDIFICILVAAIAYFGAGCVFTVLGAMAEGKLVFSTICLWPFKLMAQNKG